MKLHENLSSGSQVVPRGRTDGQTDMLRNFANAPKKNYRMNRTKWHTERNGIRNHKHCLRESIFFQN